MHNEQDEPDTEETEKTEQPTDTDDRENDGQVYVDRSKIDFDPDDGLLSGTAIDGTSKIPGPHNQGQEDHDDEAE